MDNRKVGRPRLADTDLKKKSLIVSLVMLLVSIALLAGGLISLNILPKFNKLKGEVLCTEIPARFRPYDEVNNPEGLHEYGFTDINFYSAVLNEYNSETNYCNTITEEQLATISSLSASNKEIQNINGIEYLSHTISGLNLSHNNISGEVDFSDIVFNSGSQSINLSYNKIESIIFGKVEWMDSIYLSNNNISSFIVNNQIFIGELDLSNNNLSEFSLKIFTLESSSRPDNGFWFLDLSNNNLSSIEGLTGASTLKRISIIGNNFSSLNLQYLTDLMELNIIYNPMMETKYLIKGEKIDYHPLVLNDKYQLMYSIDNENVATYNDGVISAVDEGVTNLVISNNEIEAMHPIYVYLYTKMGECGNNCDQEQILNEALNKFNITMDDLMNIPETTNDIITQEIKVYDIESDKYSIDKTKKEISYTGELNIEDIDLGLEGLAGVVEGDNYIIKDGDTIVDTYKLVNMKKEEVKPSDTDDKEETTTKSNNITTTKNDSNNVVTTTKKVKVNRKIVNTTKEEKETTTTNAIINKIIKTNKKTTTTKVVEKKNNNIRWIIWPIILIIIIIGYIVYKRNKN